MLHTDQLESKDEIIFKPIAYYFTVEGFPKDMGYADILQLDLNSGYLKGNFADEATFKHYKNKFFLQYHPDKHTKADGEIESDYNYAFGRIKEALDFFSYVHNRKEYDKTRMTKEQLQHSKKIAEEKEKHKQKLQRISSLKECFNIDNPCLDQAKNSKNRLYNNYWSSTDFIGFISARI